MSSSFTQDQLPHLSTARRPAAVPEATLSLVVMAVLNDHDIRICGSTRTLISKTSKISGIEYQLFCHPDHGVSGTPAAHLRRPAGKPHTRPEESRGSRTEEARIRVGRVRRFSTVDPGSARQPIDEALVAAACAH
jgi:hypothetical protein